MTHSKSIQRALRGVVRIDGFVVLFGLYLILHAWSKASAEPKPWQETLFGLVSNVSPRVQSNETIEPEQTMELNVWAANQVFGYVPSNRVFEQIGGFVGGQDAALFAEADVLISVPVIDLGITRHAQGIVGDRSSSD
jgi:hypothetical protein